MLSINVVKKVKAKMMEAIVAHNVHVRALNVHVWVLKNPGYNLISCFFLRIGLKLYSQGSRGNSGQIYFAPKLSVGCPIKQF